VIGKPLAYDTIEAVRARLVDVNPVFGHVGELARFGCTDHSGPHGDPAMLADVPLTTAVLNYFQTDAISRSSPTMAACIAARSAPALAAE